MNDIKMVTYSVLKYPESCKLILSQHIFSGVGTVSVVRVPVTDYGRPVYSGSWQILTLLELFLGPW